jgi:DNA-binding NtrC family response regulator
LPLAEHFVAAHAAREGKNGLKLGSDAVAALMQHEWPGNVRELQNRLQRAVLVGSGATIAASDLGIGAGARDGGMRRLTPAEISVTDIHPPAPGASRPMPPPDAADSAAERGSIEEALIRAGGVVAKAAAEMGLSRQALYRRMERLGIVLERRPR